MDPNIFTIEHLMSNGHTRASINDQIERGALERLRRGWYAQMGATDDAKRAMRLGGHLGCLSGCEAYGLWVPSFSGVHMVYGRGARPKKPTGVHSHRYDAPHPDTAVWPVEDCLAQVIQCHDMETALIVVESAVVKKLLSQEEAEALVRHTPHGDLRRYLGAARSGSETRVRLFLQQRGVPVQPLKLVPGVGEVDLLVGDNLIIECDSAAHHTSDSDRAVDGGRDMNAHLGGYQRIRLAYEQIWVEWEATKAGLIAVLRQRRHISRQRPSRAVTAQGRTRARALGLHVEDIEPPEGPDGKTVAS